MRRSMPFKYKLLSSLILLNLGFLLLLGWVFVRLNETELDGLSSVSVDAKGNLYLITGSCILKYNAGLSYAGKWGDFYKCSSESQTLPSVPERLAADGQGNLYGYGLALIDDHTIPYIQKFDQTGKLLLGWGTIGSEDGQFAPVQYPGAFTVDREGNIYMVDYGNKRIQKFDSAGHFLAKWGGQNKYKEELLPDSRAIGVDQAGNLYALVDNYVRKFNSSGSLLGEWYLPGLVQGSYEIPFGMVVDHSGNFYIGATRGIQKFDSEGRFLLEFDRKYEDTYTYPPAKAMAIDQQDNIYIIHGRAPLGAVTVHKFDSAGRTLGILEGSSLGSRIEPSLFAMCGVFSLVILLLIVAVIGCKDLLRKRRQRLAARQV